MYIYKNMCKCIWKCARQGKGEKRDTEDQKKRKNVKIIIFKSRIFHRSVMGVCHELWTGFREKEGTREGDRESWSVTIKKLYFHSIQLICIECIPSARHCTIPLTQQTAPKLNIQQIVFLQSNHLEKLYAHFSRLALFRILVELP